MHDVNHPAHCIAMYILTLVSCWCFVNELTLHDSMAIVNILLFHFPPSPLLSPWHSCKDQMTGEVRRCMAVAIREVWTKRV